MSKRQRRRQLDAEIPVKVVKPAGRKYFVLRWVDPLTRRSKEETTKVPAKESLRHLAVRAARDKEIELENQSQDTTEVTWAEFDRRYTREHLEGLSDASTNLWKVTAAHVAESINPGLLQDITASQLSRLASKLRRADVAETSIETYLRTLQAGLNWASSIDLLDECPKFPKLKGAKGKTKKMRSRPVTGEEFDRMITAVPKVRKRDPDIWMRLIRGLWLSGLRLSEALRLSWKWDSDFAIILNGSQSMYRIVTEGEKGRKDRLLPVAPEFVTWLEQQFPECPKRGRVFDIPFAETTVSKRISAIGDAAGIVVAHGGRTASAHDLRRSFATRWATRLKPAQLQALMRHESIETTMTYYVEIDAQELGDELWKHVPGGIPGGIPKSAETDSMK